MSGSSLVNHLVREQRVPFRFGFFFTEVSIDSFEKVKSRLIKVTVQFKC